MEVPVFNGPKDKKKCPKDKKKPRRRKQHAADNQPIPAGRDLRSPDLR